MDVDGLSFCGYMVTYFEDKSQVVGKVLPTVLSYFLIIGAEKIMPVTRHQSAYCLLE